MDERAAKSDERRPVTILFTDIVGSTAHAEKLDPEVWKEIVNGAHRRVTDAVSRYDGTVAQLLGDGVLAFFGAPHAHEDDPARAVRAGLEIQRAMAEYARELQGIVETFQMRVGIHTGDVVVGQVGSAEHAEYLAVGDAVNLAARLQSAAQPGTVLISETTARLVQATIELRDLGAISVKGKTEPVPVFEVVAPRADFHSGRGIAGLSSPLVGRERELNQLRGALNELRAGLGQIVFVLGEAGIGKSRLVEESTRLETGDWRKSPVSDLHWLEGRALSYGQSLSFWCIRQLLQNDLGIADGEHEIKIRVALRKRVQELFADKSDEVLPYLAQLLGVKLEGDAAERVTGFDGETLKRQILISIAEYFAKLAQIQPTVLVLEDLHWADSSSLDALERLLRVTERAPLMLVVLMRAETDKSAWRLRDLAAREYRRRFHEIELEPLTLTDANALVNNLLAIAELPDQVRQVILERAEGNPLFLEEILRALMEQGTIARDEHNHWYAKSPVSNLHLPDTLQALLLARIDRLEDDVKRTLQLASVIGRSFLFRLLEAISDAERELDWHLAQLERADLVHEKTRLPELEYMFKHSLTQEAAYESLVHERRREFHRRVANALETLFAERQEEFLGLLGYHFDRAGEKEKAIDYLLRAGDKTRLSDAHVEAIQFYERARDLLLETGDLERAAKTWLKLGLIYLEDFQYEDAHQANEAAFAMEQKAHRQPRAARTPERTDEPLRVFRWSREPEYTTLDPGKPLSVWEAQIVGTIFAGLVEFDADLNIVPHAARSWQILEGGTRYLFHLRDDVYWTDGTRMTAHDFEWTWKRNLAPNTNSPDAEVLDGVAGARDFRQGRSSDSSHVGVRAIDNVTLEVRLVEPLAYFLYVMTHSVTFPLPRRVVEQHGEEWWKPAQVVSNGAFRLLEYSPDHLTLEKNPTYFGEFPGNLDRIEWWQTTNPVERLEEYLENKVDWCQLSWADSPPNPIELVPAQEQRPLRALGITYLLLPPHPPVLDDVRVRRALLYALDRQRLFEVFRRPGLRPTSGGVVPQGIAGYSPELGLPFDITQAQHLLKEAGYAKGQAFPPLILASMWGSRLEREMVRQWHEHLGIDISIQDAALMGRTTLERSIGIFGWSADYPDPNNFLRDSRAIALLRHVGWHNQRFELLVAQAASTTDRAKRMAMYREVDRILVDDDAVIYPITYHGNEGNIELVKPWVKDLKPNHLGDVLYKNVRLEPH